MMRRFHLEIELRRIKNKKMRHKLVVGLGRSGNINKYSNSYLDFGFIVTDVNNEERCIQALAPEFMFSSKLIRHLATNHDFDIQKLEFLATDISQVLAILKVVHFLLKRIMLHLSKFYKLTKDSRHLFSCLDLISVHLGNCPSSVDAVFKKHYLVPFVPQVSYVHTHCRNKCYDLLCFDSSFQKSSQHEKVQLKQIQTKYPLCVSSRFKQTSSANHLLNEVKSKEYIKLYLINRIQLLRMLCTLAKVSTFMFSVVTPVCIGLTLFDLFAQDTALTICGAITFYSVIFNAQSYLFTSRFICKVMISSDESYLKVSHLSLFGNRRDLYVAISDIIPISGSVYDKTFYTVRFQNSAKKLILMPKGGGIDTNYDALEALFTRNDGKKEIETKE